MLVAIMFGLSVESRKYGLITYDFNQAKRLFYSLTLINMEWKKHNMFFACMDESKEDCVNWNNTILQQRRKKIDSVVQRATQTSVIAIYTHFEMCMMIMIIREVCNLMQYWISYREKE